MPISITRRAALATTALAIPMMTSGLARAAASDAETRLAGLETRSGGRLGVAILDRVSGKRIGHRADERFPMCSTFKAPAAALVLARVERGEERLDRRIAFAREDLMAFSPVTKDRTGPGGMSLAELCEAAVTRSDNTAANLLLASFGGPAALTAYLRSLGDQVTRVDRIEPALNESKPGDPRDTTTPAAMLETLRHLVLGNALSEASQAQLTAWLLASRTGDDALRAGLPPGWRVGDKTGAGPGSTNDIAVIWPPDRGPVVVTAYYTESEGSTAARNAVLAEVGRIVAAAL